MKKVRYGLVGFGNIAETRIVEDGFQENPYALLKGVHDINPERRIRAEKFGLRWYESVDELFSDPEIEGVIITTTNSTHAPLAMKALEHEKHCILEKPAGVNLNDARELDRLAAEKGLSITVDHMMKYNGYNIKSAALIRDGALGEVNDITLHMEFLFGADTAEASSWRCCEPEELGGPIGDVGSHCLYMAEFLIGSAIKDIRCVYLPGDLPIKTEQGAHIKFTFDSGVVGSARIAFDRPRGGLSGTLGNLGFEVYGSAATLRTYGTLFQLSGRKDEAVALRLDIDNGTASEQIPAEELPNIYMKMISVHAESVITGQRLDLKEGIRNLDLILKCHESAREHGIRIDIPLEEDND